MTVQTIQPAELATPARHDVIPTPTEAVTTAVEQWVGGLAAAVRGAEYIVDTPACPDSFWPLPPGMQVSKIPGKNPKVQLPNEDREQFLVRRLIAAQTAGYVVRYGLGIGLSPEVALTGIFMIGGRPSMYAEQMVALVKSRGHGHRVIERTAERCIVEVCPKDETEWRRFEFTMAEAITAGYVKGKGPNTGNDSWRGNDKYNTEPARMLYARCSSIACRTEFPHVLRGMVTYEEMLDERATADVEVTVSEARPARRVTVGEIVGEEPATAPAIEPAAAQPAPATEPAPSAAPAPEPDATPTPPRDADPGPVAMLDEKQWRTINARLNEIGVSGAGQQLARLVVIRRMVGRNDIERGGELTQAEGQLVVDNLAGESGINAVWEAIGGDNPATRFPFVGELGDRLAAQATAPASAPAVDAGVVDTGGADPDADAGYDPDDPSTHSGYGQGEPDGGES